MKTENRFFQAFNAYSKAMSKGTEKGIENARTVFDAAFIHAISEKEAVKRVDRRKEKIRIVCETYKPGMITDEKNNYNRKLSQAVKDFNNAARGVLTWENWNNADDNERYNIIKRLTKSQAHKQAKNNGRPDQEYVQFIDDVVNDVYISVCYEMTEPDGNGIESIISYKSAERLSYYVYRATGRKDRETTIDDPETIDNTLYIEHVYFPAADKQLMIDSTISAIIENMKDRDKKAAAELIKHLTLNNGNVKAAAADMGKAYTTIIDLYKRIMNAAAIVSETGKELSSLEYDIDRETETINNILTMERWKAKKAVYMRPVNNVVSFKEPVNIIPCETDNTDKYIDAAAVRAWYEKQKGIRQLLDNDKPKQKKLTYESWLIDVKGVSAEKAAEMARAAWKDYRIK